MAVLKKKNNTYSIDISLGFDSLGKRIRIRKKGIKSQKEANRINAELERNRYNNPALLTNKMTVYELYKQYINYCQLELKKGKLTKSTLRNKETVFNHHILPILGKTKIKDLTEKQISIFHEILIDKTDLRQKDKKLANQTLIKIHKQLSAFLNYCQKEHIISYNPAKIVGNFKQEKKEKDYLTFQEFQTLLSVINNPRDLFIITLFFYSGLRIGELLGIKHKNINIDENNLSNSYIDITSTYYNGEIREHTKTEESNRRIYLDEFTIEAFSMYKEYEKKCGQYNSNSYLFSSKKSKCGILSDSAIRDIIKKYLKLANIDKHITPHTFRHSHVALLIAMGKQLEDIKHRLGHKDIKTTSNEYGHMYEDNKILLVQDMTNFVKKHTNEVKKTPSKA